MPCVNVPAPEIVGTLVTSSFTNSKTFVLPNVCRNCKLFTPTLNPLFALLTIALKPLKRLG